MFIRMKNPLLIALLLVALSACFCSCKDDKKTLCDCVTTETGEYSMYLSPECEELVKQKFGPELEGMETWFQENCERVQHPKPDGGGGKISV